jgi:hypothetical protein
MNLRNNTNTNTNSVNLYSKYGLIKNPFPSIPIHSPWQYTPFFKEIFKNELSLMNEQLHRTNEQNRRTNLIIGERGCGKSALLNYFLKNCSKVSEVTSIYMSFGYTAGFAPLYRSALWWLGKDSIYTICNKTSRFQIISQNFEDFEWNSDKVFTNLLFVGDNIKFSILVDLLNLIAEENDLVIGIDGFDNIFNNLTINQKIDLLYGFSKLIESVKGNVNLFLTARVDLLRWMNENKSTLELVGVNAKIIEPNAIYLQRFSISKAYTLILNFLNQYRILDSYRENKLFPFTDEAFGAIYKASRGNLREFLILCRDVLQFSASHNYSDIGGETISKFLRDFRVYSLNYFIA